VYVNRWKDGPPSFRCLLPGHADADSPQKKLHDLLGAVDSRVLEAAKANASKWFKKGVTPEFLDGAFSAIVKEGRLNEDTGSVGAPSFKCGIQRRASGDVVLPICDGDGQPIAWDDFEANHARYNVTMIVELGDVWMMPGMFGVSLRARMVKAERKADALDFSAFHDETVEEADEPSAKRAKATAVSAEDANAAAAFL